MLPISLIRENIEKVRSGVKAKGETVDLNKIVDLDQQQRDLLTILNELRAERNRSSEEIGKVKSKGGNTSDAIKEMKSVSEEIKMKEAQLAGLNDEIAPLLDWVPNLPHSSVPDGKGTEDNVEIRKWGQVPEFTFKPKDHLELGSLHKLFDFKRGAAIAGSGFPLYTGAGARLERSLINYMLDFHTNKYGDIEIFPPFAARAGAMRNTAQIPKLQDDMYHISSDELYLIPTAEVPVTNIHQDEILNEADLPINYAAYSACFRREAGSYGKETRGFTRLHQFNKVELVKFVKPETSFEQLEKLTAQAEAVLQSLGLHYRVLELCSGDLSFASAKSYDLEVWAPGENRWLEVSTCSNFEAFQARRAKIRYRREADKKVDFVHTLNGSGVATPRLLIALLETYQQSDGSIKLPEPLHSYFGSEGII